MNSESKIYNSLNSENIPNPLKQSYKPPYDSSDDDDVLLAAGIIVVIVILVIIVCCCICACGIIYFIFGRKPNRVNNNGRNGVVEVEMNNNAQYIPNNGVIPTNPQPQYGGQVVLAPQGYPLPQQNQPVIYQQGNVYYVPAQQVQQHQQVQQQYYVAPPQDYPIPQYSTK